MTTTVKIGAHLGDDHEVLVDVREGGRIIETFTLQDGESADRYVYDDRTVTVREVAKLP